MNLDRFKMTNDTLGHTMGDKLLQFISDRLLIATDDFDTVARLGGDEFVILLTDLEYVFMMRKVIARNLYYSH